MKSSIKIIVMLAVSSLFLIFLLYFSTQKVNRFDQVELAESGVTLDQNAETVQFSKGDVLYRMWNDNEMIEKKDNKAQVLPNSMLFMGQDKIMFTKKSTIIDTNGVAKKSQVKSPYQLNENDVFQNKQSSISENSVVKLSKRMYYLNAEADIYFGKEKVSTVNRPLLLVDKTGSVIVYDAPTKKRYLGHLILKIDDEKRLDVSDEKYYVGKKTIDLASFGGTDNQKLVVNDKEKAKKVSIKKNDEKNKHKDKRNSDLTVQRSYANKSLNPDGKATSKDSANPVTGSGTTNNPTGTGSQGDSSGSNGSGGGSDGGSGGSDGGSGGNDQGQDGSLSTLENYQELLDLLSELQQQNEKTIPLLTVNYIQPEVSQVAFSYQMIDVDHVRVGAIEVALMDAKTNKRVETLYAESDNGKETFRGLTPNKEFYMIFKYKYDLGDDKGVQSLEVKSSLFKTEEVHAVYQLNSIASQSMAINVKLDQVITNISRARLNVLAEDGTTFYVEGNAGSISREGQTFNVANLTPETKYQFQLEIVLDSGATIILDQSEWYRTLEGTKLKSLTADLLDHQVIRLAYQWESAEYQLLDAFIELQNADTGQMIPYYVTGQNEREMTVVPNTRQTSFALKAGLNLIVSDKQTGAKKTLTYPCQDVLTYNHTLSMSLLEPAQDVSNHLAVLNYLPESAQTNVAENPANNDSSAIEETDESAEQLLDQTIDSTTEQATQEANEPTDILYAYQLNGQSEPAGTQYVIKTERRNKQSMVDTFIPNISLDDVWQSVSSEVVSTEGNQLNYTYEVSQLALRQFEYRQVVYDRAENLLMVIYPK